MRLCGFGVILFALDGAGLVDILFVPLLAFAVILFFGKWLDKICDRISLAAMGFSFLLSVYLFLSVAPLGALLLYRWLRCLWRPGAGGLPGRPGGQHQRLGTSPLTSEFG